MIEKNKRMKQDKNGFTLVEIVLVVGIIGLVMAIGIPSFVKPREIARQNICIDNMRLLDTAKEIWALENLKNGADTPVATDLDIYLKNGTFGLICPSDSDKTFITSYTVNNVNKTPVCNIVPVTHVF